MVMNQNMQPNNPFLISGYYSPDYFCDREQETAAIADALSNGRNITLVAPRRIGKTGLIHHFFYHVNHTDPEIVTLYMDIYSTQSLGDFVKLFANTILGKLDSTPRKMMKSVSNFIRSCRPVFTMDEVTGAPKVTIDITSNNEESTLKEIFDYIGASKKRCYIAIDEFQQINEYAEKGIEAQLRSYIQFLPNVNFIFAGSKQHVMQEMFTSSKRPFYQSTQLLNIGTIDRKKYSDFAQKLFQAKGMNLPTEIFEDIYDKFAGHTWYIQDILNRLYSYNRDVDESSVSYAIDQIISELSTSYVDLLRVYPAGCNRLLKAIAREGTVKEILSGWFISKYKLRAPSSVSSALKKLTDQELVYRTDSGYILYDRFMAEWLRRLPY
jgi:AAA+ ATPase superfamily predicted ATPase